MSPNLVILKSEGCLEPLLIILQRLENNAGIEGIQYPYEFISTGSEWHLIFYINEQESL